jgi:hypothetical protein
MMGVIQPAQLGMAEGSHTARLPIVNPHEGSTQGWRILNSAQVSPGSGTSRARMGAILRKVQSPGVQQFYISHLLGHPCGSLMRDAQKRETTLKKKNKECPSELHHCIGWPRDLYRTLFCLSHPGGWVQGEAGWWSIGGQERAGICCETHGLSPCSLTFL